MEGSVNGFILVSISFHAIPVIFMIEYTVLATRQKLKLLDTLNTFKIANTKCFDPNDRTVVEKAISSWFAGDGGEPAEEKKSLLPEWLPGQKKATGVDLRAIERFEGDVRGGATNRMIMSSVGNQPGLLRVRDLAVIFYTVWIPSGLDFCVRGEGRGNEMVFTFMLLITPVAQSLGFIFVAWAAGGLFRVRTDWPKWLLHIILFFVFFGSMAVMQTLYIFIFGVCQTACMLPVPF